MHKRDQKEKLWQAENKINKEDRAFEGSATREVEERVVEILAQYLSRSSSSDHCKV